MRFLEKYHTKMVDYEFQIDSEKYTKLLTRIDGWNKQQEKNRFTWNY